MSRTDDQRIADFLEAAAELDTIRERSIAAFKSDPILQRAAERNRVELCFTPTCSSRANPIEPHFGPLREFVLNNSNHPNHVVLTRRLQAHLRWRTRTPGTRTSSPLNAENEPRSEPRKVNTGADPHHSAHGHPRKRSHGQVTTTSDL